MRRKEEGEEGRRGEGRVSLLVLFFLFFFSSCFFWERCSKSVFGLNCFSISHYIQIKKTVLSRLGRYNKTSFEAIFLFFYFVQRACDCSKDFKDNRSTSIFDALKEFGERDHRVPITEEVKEFGEIGTHSLPESKISETSYFKPHMHFDGSVESIADSDLEDGESQKDAAFTTVCPESCEETRCVGRAGERGKCTIDSSRKRKFEVSLI